MFSSFLRKKYVRYVTTLLIAIFTLTIALVADPGMAFSKAKKLDISLAAVGIENLTKYELLEDDYGVAMMLAGISGLEGIRVMPQEKVLEVIGDMEPNPDVAISVGKSLGADAVLVGFITDIEFDGTEQAVVEVGLSMYNVEDGSLMSEAVVQGRSTRLGFSGSLAALAELAIRDGVETAIGFIFENLTTFGVVTLVRGNEVLCSLAERDNVRKEAELAVLQKDTGKQIASLDVKEVSIAHSRGKIIGQQSGTSVSVGDRVRLVYTPVVLERTEGTNDRVPKKRKFSPLIMGALAIGVIAAVSRGGNKAEPPNPARPPGLEYSLVTSSNNQSAVYSPTTFDPDYLPAKPVAISASEIASKFSCYASNNSVELLEETAFDFTLKTSPKNPVFPSTINYSILFSLQSLLDKTNGYTTSEISKLKCATCSDDDKWEYLESATYSRSTYMDNDYTLTCPVSHFTPYGVVIDDRPDPISAPTLYIECGDRTAKLSWIGLNDTNNNGYQIFSCTNTTESSCGSEPIETIYDTSTTTKTYSGLSNGAQVCYAVSGSSSNTQQGATMSSVKCTTPSSSAADCQSHTITLVTPEDQSTIEDDTPEFIFVGAGDMDFYTLKVVDVESTNEIFTKTIDGEGADSTERKDFSVTYAGSTLENGKQYRWSVDGWKSGVMDVESSPFTFTFEGKTGECCDIDGDEMANIAPADGTDLIDAPTLKWQPVECAEEYLVLMYDESSTLIFQETVTSGTEVSVSEDQLTDDVQYQWYVTSSNACSGDDASSKMGTTWRFTKRGKEAVELPIPEWVSGSGKVAITGGDQIVSLNWNRVDDNVVTGYAIYRSESLSSLDSSTPIDIIYKTQLGGPMPDEDCPVQFTENNPGYCDISVDNGTRYYYKIASVKTGDIAGIKSVLKSIILVLQRPSLIGPGDVTVEDVMTSLPLFQWFPVNGPDVQYILSLIDDDEDIVVWEPTTSSTSQQYDGNPLEDGKSYRWTVKAFNGLTEAASEDSQTFRFKKVEAIDRPDAINFCGGSYCASQQSDPYETSNTNNSIKLFWEKPSSDNVNKFRIYRCQDTPGICTTYIADTDNVQCGTSMSNVVCYEDTYLERGSTYYYNIVAVDSADPNGSDPDRVSDYSTTLEVVLLLKGPTLVYPVYDSVVNVPQPDMTFLREDGATQYLVQIVKKPDTFSNPSNYLWSYSLETSGSGLYTVQYNMDDSAKGPLLNPSDPDIAGTQYEWRVCSLNERNTIPQCSNSSKFYKNLKPPQTLSPDSGEQIVTDTILFQWTSTPGAAGYSIRICKRSGSGTDCSAMPIIHQADVTSGVSYSYDAGNLDLCDIGNDPTCTIDGAYYWEIRAYDSYGSVSGSWANANRELFYKIFGEAPQLIIPTDGTIIGPSIECALTSDFYGNPTYNYNITFRWVDIGADAYVLRIEDIEASDDASNPSDPNIVVIYEGEMSAGQFGVNENCGIGSSDVLPFSAGRKFRWNVTAGSTPYDTDNAREFSTGLPAPDLVSPLDGEQVLLVDNCDAQSSTLCLHFDWNGGTYEDSNGIVREISGIIGAESYDVEILKNGLPYLCEAQFTYDPGNPPDPPFTPTNNTFCDMSTPTVINGDVFTWRVRARDASGEATQSGTGIPGPWSPINQFTVLIPPVILATPPDDSGTCDPYNQPDTIQTDCTIVACLNQNYYWSPIPFAFGRSCYKIDVSDTTDFRNLLISKDTQTASTFFLQDSNGNYNGFQADTTDYIPMTNGVVYYWRVGASVHDGSGDCGFTWIYSDTWQYFKRPPIAQNVSATVAINDATVSWTPPVNCPPASSGQALSYPEVPPAGGEYIVYLESEMPDATNPPTHIAGIYGAASLSASIGGLTADSDYAICVAVVDNSFYINHPGHVSDFTCVSAHTLPEEEN